MTRKARSRVVTALAIVAVSSVVLVLSSMAYGFCVGAVEAGWTPRWIPAAVMDAYCWPEHAFEQIPIVGIPMRLADDMGYRFAGGPETTR